MRQRLLLARSLVAQPRVLLLDEPTRSLDPVSAESLRRFLRDDLARRAGCTIVLATHNAEEAFHLCDRVGILDRGRLLAVGRASELVDRFGDARYRLCVGGEADRVRHLLAATAIAHDVTVEPTEEAAWQMVECALAGGTGTAAEVVATLVTAGIPVARCERVGLPLAELIRRVVRQGEEVGGA
jgi:ABC-2 type transport system ATP-binding protein